MKTSLSSTLSSLAALMTTAVLLSTVCPAFAEGSDEPENPDQVCKYKKKKKCSTGSSSDESTFEVPMGEDGKCPDASSFAKVDDEYEYTFEGTAPAPRSAQSRTTEKRIIAGGFGANYVSPESIHFYGEAEDIVRDANANIRQIKNVDLLTDFVFTGEKTLEIRQYKTTDLQPGKTQGLYVPKPGIEPLYLTRMSQSADGNIVRTDIINNEGDVPSVKTEEMEQRFDQNTQTLTLIKRYKKGEGLSETVYKEATTKMTAVLDGLPKEEKYFSEEKELGTDNVMHVVSRKSGRRAVFKEEDGLVKLYECNAVNEDGTPMNPIATETNYTYYADPMKPESFGKVRTQRRNDGYWENKYYDSNANAGIEIEKTESPWLNTAAHEPGEAPSGKIRTRVEVTCSTDTGLESLTETVDGIAIAKEWTEKSQVNQQQVREVRHQPHSGGEKVTTTVRYRRAKDVPTHLTGKPVSVHHTDGNMELYNYALNGQDLKVTVDKGYGDGNSVTHGTRTVNTKDKDSGNLKEEVRYALEGGQAYWLGSKTGVNFDNKGVALKWVYDNNPDDYTEQRKDCCHVTWERGRDGIAATYTYDEAGRKTSITSRGITYTTEYSGPTTTQWKQAEGSSQRYLVEQTTKNLAQQTVGQKSPVVGGKALTTQFSFDLAARRSTTTTPHGTTVSIISSADGQLLSETGTIGLTQTYTYTPTTQNGGGLVVMVTDGNRSRTKVKDLLGNTITEQSSPNSLTQHFYDALGRIIKTTLPDGEIQLYTYENETLIGGIDLNGDGILNSAHDRMIKSERSFDSSWPDGKGSWKTTTANAWQGNWKPVSISWKTEDGTQARQQTLGLSGYTLQQKTASAQRGASHTDSATSPDGRIQETAYTINNGQVTTLAITRKDANGHVVTTENRTLDDWGNTVTRTNARTGTTTYTYDEGTGTLISQTEPNQSITSYQYDDFGRQVTIVLPDGSEQHIAYDADGRITRRWGSQQYLVSYEYNAYGQMTGMTTYRIPVGETAAWPEGVEGDKTTWTYDSATGNLMQKMYADGKGMSYTYTPGRKLLTQMNARGSITTNSYDSAGQLVKVHVNDNGMTPTKTFSYDQLGRQVSATTEGVASYQYHYNDQNQVIEEQITIPTSNGNLERSLVRSYDTYGRATGYQLKQGNAVEQDISYTYTPAGQLAAVMADGKEFTYAYVPNAPQLVSQVTSPIHTVTNTYEVNRNILTSNVNRWKNKVDSPIISGYSYTVNSLGQRVSVSTEGEAFGTNPADWTWGYDALGQVSSANEDRYTYDQIGNRRTSRKGNDVETGYHVNALNQYAQIGTVAPTYDADGNLLSGLTPTTILPNRNTLSFAYNAENRPVSVARNGESLENYSYDHKGRRINKGDAVTLYDGYNAIAEYKDGTRSLKTTYAWGDDLSGTAQGAGGVGGLLCVTEHDRQLPLVSYPCYDGNGNITEYLTEENAGTLAAHYEYDSFGQVIKKTGKEEYSYQFSTKPYEYFSGLNYYNYRDYDSNAGRWINRDPLESSLEINKYLFSNNNSISSIDLLGLTALKSSIVLKKKAWFGSDKVVFQADMKGEFKCSSTGNAEMEETPTAKGSVNEGDSSSVPAPRVTPNQADGRTQFSVVWGEVSSVNEDFSTTDAMGTGATIVGGVGTIIGGAVGGTAGSIVPGAGTIGGVAVGGAAGCGIGAAFGGVGGACVGGVAEIFDDEWDMKVTLTWDIKCECNKQKKEWELKIKALDPNSSKSGDDDVYLEIQ